jgi:hypothetical protein
LNDLASLGTGYPMYFTFMKHFIWVLLFLFICISIPCILVAVLQINKEEYTKLFESIKLNSFITKMTIGKVMEVIVEDNSNAYLGNILLGFNMTGIFCVVFYSIILKKKMYEMQNQLDWEKDTPSDYAILVRNVPLSFARDKNTLKEYFETEYSAMDVKVSEVNYCYEVS